MPRAATTDDARCDRSRGALNELIVPYWYESFGRGALRPHVSQAEWR